MARHGAEFSAAIGKKGGAAVKEMRGPEFYSEMGKKGSAATRACHGREHYSRIGAMSGNAGKQGERNSPTTLIPAPDPTAGAS